MNISHANEIYTAAHVFMQGTNLLDITILVN